MLQNRFITLAQLHKFIINYPRFKLIKYVIRFLVLICMIWGGILTDHLSTHIHIFIYKIIYIAQETSNHTCEREP